MRNVLLLIGILLISSILMFIIFTKADYPKLNQKEALKIGEEKYLEFLWIVDGAFNDEIMEGSFTVNGKKLSQEMKFTCVYKNKNDKTCIGNNFEAVFHNLFASAITYNDVYSDDSENGWLKYEKGKYLFTNINTCNVRRMNLNQTIKIFKIEKDKLLFDVLIEDSDYQNSQSREFVLVKENNLWKISRAYYEDLCEIKYSIG